MLQLGYVIWAVTDGAASWIDRKTNMLQRRELEGEGTDTVGKAWHEQNGLGHVARTQGEKTEGYVA